MPTAELTLTLSAGPFACLRKSPKRSATQNLSRGGRALEREAQPKPEHALIHALAADAAGARDRRKAPQIPH